jgi:hypothetical protein
LVHCFGGRSRSAAFVAAYLMSSRSWGFDQAMAVICAVRPVASVNRGFERQLRAYAQTGYDVYAAQQVLLRNRIRALHEIRGSWRSPATQSFRKHRSSGKLPGSSRNIVGSSSSGSRNEYDAKGSHGVGLGCDSFTANGMCPSFLLLPVTCRRCIDLSISLLHYAPLNRRSSCDCHTPNPFIHHPSSIFPPTLHALSSSSPKAWM